MIDKAQYFEELSSWLDTLGYNRFTFVVSVGYSDTYILDNSTRLNKLKQYGEIIPQLHYLQLYTPNEREKMIDQCLKNWSDKVGYVPDGMMTFIPDTHVSQYISGKGLHYVQGYCFDQYAIDYMTERGGFQLPYYAHPSHVLIPNNQTNRGLVVLPHVTLDWLDSFRVNQSINLHPINLLRFTNGNITKSKQLFLNLIDNSLSNSEPFGLAVSQFEWCWAYDLGYTDAILDWINTTLRSRTYYDYWSFKSLTKWFSTNYPRTPSYHIIFQSPYSGEKIEWYYDLNGRVARIGTQVISFVQYTNQEPDKYLTQVGSINWAGNSTDPNNCVDDSLRFEVDALGGGWLSAPVGTFSCSYSGNIESFAVRYVAEKTFREFQAAMTSILSVIAVAVFTAVILVSKAIKR